MTVEGQKARQFEQLVMPHLDSAYNLARWLTRCDADAQDVVQEACLRAFKYFAGFEGQYPKAWLLKIVRNTWHNWHRHNHPAEEMTALDDDIDEIDRRTVMLPAAHGAARDPEMLLIQRRDKLRLDHLISELPAHYREALILREMEEMSYREIAEITGVPIGTVMSRLARGRQYLQTAWRGEERRERRA